MIYLLRSYSGEVPKCELELSFLIEDELISKRDCFSEKGIEGSKRAVIVSSHAELMNAELENADAIIWNAPYSDILENIVPKKRRYGWQLQSINTPFFISVKSLKEFDSFATIDFNGVYSDELDALLQIAKIERNE
ncbi:MAG: hypothetical protein ACI857_002157 [Arenicella sp.]|jgi:hypothetical protein